MPAQLGRSLLVWAMLATSGCVPVRTTARPYLARHLRLDAVDATARTPIEGAELALVSDSGRELSVTPNGKGWLLRDFAPGRYTIRISAPGYVTARTPSPVVLKPGTVRLHLGKGDPASEGALDWSFVTPPRFVDGHDPRCTDLATVQGVRGTLIAKCMITEGGEVRDCKVVQSLPYMEAEVLRTLQSRKYSPAMDGEAPIATPYEFRINISCG